LPAAVTVVNARWVAECAMSVAFAMETRFTLSLYAS
jgi:hypothetical protein